MLVGRQFVLDAHEQRDLLPLNFTFCGQHLFQLRKNLLLVDARLLDQRNQLLHFILQFPLQLREFQLRGADFRLEIVFLLDAEPNRYPDAGSPVFRDGVTSRDSEGFIVWPHGILP